MNRKPDTAKDKNRAKKKAPAEGQDLIPIHLSEDDQLNWKIVSFLQEDGRMPFSTIANKVGVSEGTIRNRVKQLRDDNYMEISAAVLPETFGYHWNSIVLIKVNTGTALEDVARRLSNVPEVYYVVQMTGPHDLAITSFHRDGEHFREFLNEHIYNHTDILSFEANVNLKVYKMKIKWHDALV